MGTEQGLVMRAFERDRDMEAVTRIWRECGWIGTEDAQATALATFFSVGSAWVATVDDVAECAVHATPGSYRWMDTDLPLWAITAVTTSHTVRKRGAATDLMSEALADGHDRGMAVSGLGIFEQGYYDRFGFGTLPYDHRFSIDPGSLSVPVPDRVPVRFGVEEAADFHALYLRRHRGHGSAVLDPPEFLRGELGFAEKPFGLGFRAEDGRLTHALFGETSDENGPYTVDHLVAETPTGIIELLGLLRSLEDQVTTIVFNEPPGTQLQDLIRRPIRQRNKRVTVGGDRASQTAVAWSQIRILDLDACIAAVRWEGDPVEFVVELDDPLAGLGGRWRGIGGCWRIRLGTSSEVAPAPPGAVPDLRADVSTFSRLWAGARPATSLRTTAQLVGDPALLGTLDRVLRLPTPQLGWPF